MAATVTIVKPSWRQNAVAEENVDIADDLTERLAKQFVWVPTCGADLLTLHLIGHGRAVACACIHCNQARALTSNALAQVPMSDLDRDRIHRLTHRANGWDSRLVAAAVRFDLEPSELDAIAKTAGRE